MRVEDDANKAVKLQAETGWEEEREAMKSDSNDAVNSCATGQYTAGGVVTMGDRK